ncbi:MAG TPA: aspartyl protease family protein [Bacteroidales bacterium]|nr:aspartyl protease family protein [Bacteroidales bacterium]HNS47380.1 aspartyl protease family protein [Bacteroidales bacterium]
MINQKNGRCAKSMFFIFFIFIFFFVNFCRAQSIGYAIVGDHNRMSVTFENLNNLVVMPVKINGLLPSKFILDSGVSLTLLTEKALCDILEIPCDRRISLPVIGLLDSITGCIATGVKIDLPGVKSHGQNLVVLDEDYLNLKSFLGNNVQGIIGYDLFRNFVVDVDYINKIVTLIQPGHFRPPRKYEKISVEMISNRPYIQCEATDENGYSHTLTMLVDLGASFAIMFEIDSAQVVGIPSTNLETVVGRGLGGDIAGYVGRIKQFKIGSYVLDDVIASFYDKYRTHDVIPEVRQGAIGGDVLSRFQLIIDYPGKAIYLKRNFSFNRSFEFNLSGIEMVASGIGLNLYTITRVIPRSPADRAGILPGDRIVMFNGKSTEEMALNELNHELRLKPGKKIWLRLERNGQRIKRSFKLERSI